MTCEDFLVKLYIGGHANYKGRDYFLQGDLEQEAVWTLINIVLDIERYTKALNHLYIFEPTFLNSPRHDLIFKEGPHLIYRPIIRYEGNNIWLRIMAHSHPGPPTITFGEVELSGKYKFYEKVPLDLLKYPAMVGYRYLLDEKVKECEGEHETT